MHPSYSTTLNFISNNRLKLLIASARAGNNAHDNEILSIVEEMREQQIIL
jgi:hypothetical protein